MLRITVDNYILLKEHKNIVLFVIIEAALKLS